MGHQINIRVKADELKKKLDIKDGITPIKGVDYFDGKDGEDGIDGKDYILTDSDKQEIAESIDVPIVEKIIEKTEVIKEQPIYNTTEIVKEVNKEITQEEINNIAIQINPIIDYSKIKNAPKFPSGGLNRITKEEVQQMIDAIPEPTSDFLSLTDTPLSYDGEAGKGVRVNSEEDGLEFYATSDSGEKVKLNASDPTAGYLDDKIGGYGFITDISGLVPYSGATQDVDLGEFQLKASGLEVGENAITFSDGSFSGTLNKTTLTEARDYTLPDNTGTIALTSDIPNDLADLADDSTHRLVTDTEKSGWDGKQDALGFTPEDSANKDQASGYAGLDSDGRINPNQLPAIAITDTFVVASEVAMLALTAEVGDVAIRTDLNKTFILQVTDPSVLEHWKELLTPTDTVSSVFGRTGTVTAQNGDYTADQVSETENRIFPTPTQETNWDTAYGWGNHAGLYDLLDTASGLLSTHNSTYNHSLIATALQEETDPVFTAWLETSPLASFLTDISGQDLSLADNSTSAFITIDDVPTNVSEFTNDAGYITSSALIGYVTTGVLLDYVTTTQLLSYVPYTGASSDVDLGENKLTTDQADIKNIILQSDLIFNTIGYGTLFDAGYQSSASSPYTVSASTEYNAEYAAWKACDNNSGTRWSSSSTGGTGWLKIDFGTAKTASRIVIKPFSGQVNAWNLQGSNDNSNWTTLITSSHANSDATQTEDFVNTTAYRYYLFNVLSSYTGYQGLWDLDLFGSTSLIQTNVFQANTGKVGIGTITPSEMLSVVGKITATDGDVTQTFPIKYVKVSDVKAYNTHGGTFTAGAWRTRDINTEDNDDGGICSISSNQITLQAGTYIVDVKAPSYQTDRSVLRLYNITASAELIRGQVGRSATSDTTQVIDTLNGQFTLSKTSVLEVQHRATSTSVGYGFGVGNNWSHPDVFTVAQFWKVN